MFDPVCTVKQIGPGLVNVSGDHPRIDEIERMLEYLPREIGGAIQARDGRVYGTVLEVIERRGFTGCAVLKLLMDGFEIRPE